MNNQNAGQNAGLWKRIVGSFVDGMGGFFGAIWETFSNSFKPDYPPPDPEIPLLRRCCATVSGAVASLLLIFLVLAVIFRDEQRLETITDALSGYVGTFAMVLALISLLLAIYWGIAHDDRAEYKLLVSSALVTMFFPLTLLILLVLLPPLIDMIL